MAYILTENDRTRLDWAIRYMSTSQAGDTAHGIITEEVAKQIAPVAVNSGAYETEGAFLEEVGERSITALLRLLRHVGD